jgi:hypothetical protein
MRLSHTPARISTVFDDPNLVASAGLVPVMGLAERAGLEVLTQRHLGLPGDKGANAGLKVSSLVAGMVAGADCIDDMAVLRHGGMAKVFDRIYAPSTLGSFLRAFTFGHLRQLDAVAARFLHALAGITSLLSPQQTAHGDGRVRVRRCRRHRGRGPRSRQAGCRVRLQQGPRLERTARHRNDTRVGTSDRGAATPQRRLRLRARRETAGR